MQKTTIKIWRAGLVAGMCAGLLIVAACSSTRAARPKIKPIKGVPTIVNEAYLRASDDVIIGIGAYKLGSDMSKMSMAKTVAETRARTDIARQLQTIVKNMVTDYTASSELDLKSATSFQESITQALVKTDLRGAKTVNMQTLDGVLWVVMEYSKKAAEDDFNAVASAAKLAVPAAAAFDAVSRMEAAFDKTAGGGPVPAIDSLN